MTIESLQVRTGPEMGTYTMHSTLADALDFIRKELAREFVLVPRKRPEGGWIVDIVCENTPEGGSEGFITFGRMSNR